MADTSGVFVGFLLGLVSSHSLEWVRGIRAFNVIRKEFYITNERIAELAKRINARTDHRQKLIIIQEAPMQRTMAWTSFSASLPPVVSANDISVIYERWDKIDTLNSIHKYLKDNTVWNTEYDDNLDTYLQHWMEIAVEINEMPLPEPKTFMGLVSSWLHSGYEKLSKVRKNGV
jgi:hypothetical protein